MRMQQVCYSHKLSPKVQKISVTAASLRIFQPRFCEDCVDIYGLSLEVYFLPIRVFYRYIIFQVVRP